MYIKYTWGMKGSENLFFQQGVNTTLEFNERLLSTQMFEAISGFDAQAGYSFNFASSCTDSWGIWPVTNSVFIEQDMRMKGKVRRLIISPCGCGSRQGDVEQTRIPSFKCPCALVDDNKPVNVARPNRHS